MVKVNLSKTDLLLLKSLTGEFQPVTDIVARVFEHLEYLENNRGVSKSLIPEDIHIFYVTLEKKLYKGLNFIQPNRSRPLGYRLKPQFSELPQIISDMNELQWIQHSQALSKNDIKILDCCSSEPKNSTSLKAMTKVFDKKALQEKIDKLKLMGLLEEDLPDQFTTHPLGKRLLDVILPSAGATGDVSNGSSAESSTGD